jgi:hypothetical protein
MALAAKKPCGHGQCPALVSRPNTHCPKHAKQTAQREYQDKRNDPIWKMRQEPRWKKFRAWYLRAHPACMLLVAGKPCAHIATHVHHRRGLRSHPEDLCDEDQCAALCREHHDNHDGDRPGDEYADVT